MSSIKLCAYCLYFSSLLMFSVGSDNATITGRNKSDFKFLIQGGYRPTTHTLAKYIVSLRNLENVRYFGSNVFCGGSIYNKHTIITAAHCVVKHGKVKSKILIIAGNINRHKITFKTQARISKKVIVYPRYREGSHMHDLALIILNKDLNFDGKTVASVQLPKRKTKAGTECTVFGWGRLFMGGPGPSELLYVDVHLWSDLMCSMHDGTSKGMICANNPDDFEKDACHGDSGGPLICNDQLVGAVSWGRGCGQPNQTGVYADIWYYRYWIIKNNAQQLKATKFMLIIIMVNFVKYIYIRMMRNCQLCDEIKCCNVNK